MCDYPLVSVLMPLYNKAGFVAEAIESVLNQTYPNIELIIVDDGSTDESWTIANRFVSDKVFLIKQENKGASAARNIAFDYSKGDFIQHLDADDVLDSRKIEKQVTILRGRIEPVLATAKRFYFQKQIMDSCQPLEILEIEKDYSNTPAFLLDDAKCSILLHSWLIPRGLIEKAGKWDETMIIFEDRDFYLRLVPLASKIIFCANAVCYYRLPTIEHHKNRSRITDFKTVLSYFARFEAFFLSEHKDLIDESRFILACLYKKLLNITSDRATIAELKRRSVRLGLAPDCHKSQLISWFEKTIGVKNTFGLVYLKSKFIDTL